MVRPQRPAIEIEPSRPVAEAVGGYFAQTGEQLVAALILAAAVSGENILAVRRWVNNPKASAPIDALNDARFHHVADNLTAISTLVPEQRDGVYGTADTMTRFLAFESIHPWITPGPGRTPFDPIQFVTSKDTLYSLSREGTGSMGPLVTAQHREKVVGIALSCQIDGLGQGRLDRRPHRNDRPPILVT